MNLLIYPTFSEKAAKLFASESRPILLRSLIGGLSSPFLHSLRSEGIPPDAFALQSLTVFVSITNIRYFIKTDTFAQSMVKYGVNMFKPNTALSPGDYISKIDEPRRGEIQRLHEFIRASVPDLKPFMISGMIGYGPYQYRSKSGREGEWCVVALASQKNYISVYACGVKDGQYVAERYKDKLPKASIGKSCIRFKKVDDIDLTVMKTILKEAEKYPMGKAE